MKKIFIYLVLSFAIISSESNATASLNIDNKDIPKTKIIFGSGLDINSNNPNNNDMQLKNAVNDILARVTNNLNGTDLFEVLKKEQPVQGAIVPESLSIEKIPDFVKYRAAGVGMLVVYDASLDQTNNLEIKVRLWDTLDERQLFGKFYSGANYKKIASLISDEIFKAATGEKNGFFDSKITYIAESGGFLKRIKRIATEDFDGENHRYLTNGRDLVLTPVFSRQKNEILFVRFFGEKPQIYSIGTDDGLIRKIGGFRGTTFAPAVNPQDPNLIVFSVIDNGNSNIYQMNLLTNQVTRLTSSRAIDTTPSYSPDGNYIVFSSDRGGSQQLYVMNNDGSDLREITSGDGNYSKPVWSPDGSFIAFTKIKAGGFTIGLISPNGRNEKSITSGYLIEGAKWSPNGRYLLYSRTNGSYGKASIPRLYVVDIVTGFERLVPTPEGEGASDPDWVSN